MREFFARGTKQVPIIVFLNKKVSKNRDETENSAKRKDLRILKSKSNNRAFRGISKNESVTNLFRKLL